MRLSQPFIGFVVAEPSHPMCVTCFTSVGKPICISSSESSMSSLGTGTKEMNDLGEENNRKMMTKQWELPKNWEKFLKPFTSLWKPVEMFGFGRARSLNEFFMLSEKLSWSSSCAPFTRQMRNQKQDPISLRIKKQNTQKKKKGKRKTKKQRERTDGRWVCVRFWSSRLLLTHSHTGIRHTACSEGKNDEPLHSVSHCLSTVTKERSREERGDVVVEEIQNFEVELVYYIGWLLALLSS